MISALAVALAMPGGARASEKAPSTSAPGRPAPRGEHMHRIGRPPRPAKVPESLARLLPRHAFPAAPGDLDESATAAGRWAAEAIARREGRRVFYRAGFYDGTRLALEILPEFSEDYAEGLRDGGRDPRAPAHGRIAGAAAAEETSRAEAARRVEAQYMDLSAEPRLDARPVAPPWRPVVAGIEPPALEEVFRGVAEGHVPGLTPAWSDAFRSWRHDPWSLHACASHAEFLDERWADSEAAFDLWLEAPHRSAPYRGLQLPADKARFKDVFRAAYSVRLAMLYEEDLALSYEMGHADGWTWGAVAVAEWRYHAGYAEGFGQAALIAAGAAYAALYPVAYHRHYEEQFTSWSRTSVPGIISVRLEDGTDDGIFQPGEPIRAWVEAANYGGAAGRWNVVITSDLIERAASLTLDAPARRVVSPPAPVELRLRREVERGRESAVAVTLGDLREEVSLVISYPLALTGNVRLTTLEVPEGRAVAEVEVANRSRRTLGGVLTMLGPESKGAPPEPVLLEALLPGEARPAVFRLEGLEPIAALAGDVEMHFELTSGETLHDEMTWSFPPIALDLQSHELDRYLVALAMDRTAPRSDVEAAIDLALERVAADWAAAVDGEGNPYKHDYEQRDGTTALGGLVRAYQKERARMSHREVFERLGAEIESMAGDLPGPHPFLRKYLLRLARRLG